MRRIRRAYSPYGGRKRHPLLAALLCVLLAAVIAFGVLEGVVLSGGRTQIAQGGGAPEVMIIFGCQVKPWGPSVLLQDRLDTALDYLEELEGRDLIPFQAGMDAGCGAVLVEHVEVTHSRGWTAPALLVKSIRILESVSPLIRFQWNRTGMRSAAPKYRLVTWASMDHTVAHTISAWRWIITLTNCKLRSVLSLKAQLPVWKS